MLVKKQSFNFDVLRDPFRATDKDTLVTSSDAFHLRPLFPDISSREYKSSNSTVRIPYVSNSPIQLYNFHPSPELRRTSLLQLTQLHNRYHQVGLLADPFGLMVADTSNKHSANCVSESVKGATSTAFKEANKNVAKDPNAPLSTRADAAADMVGDKVDG